MSNTQESTSSVNNKNKPNDQMTLVDITKNSERLSAYYKRVGGNVKASKLAEYARAARMIFDTPNRHINDVAFLGDFLSTMTLIESDKAKTNEGLHEISRELISLPRLERNTIKLSELVIKPEIFDGEKPKPRRWIHDFNEAIVANGWSDEISVKYLPTFLTKAAKDWYFTEVRPALTPETKWYEVYTLFVENYLGTNDYEQLHRAVEKARQREGETVSNYIPRLRRLLLLLTPRMSEADQLGYLKNKLRPEYKPLLAYDNPDTIKKLRECCLKIEAGFPEKIKNKRDEAPNTTGNRGTDRSPRNTETKRTPPQPRRSGQTSQITCYNCGKIGHISRNCTQPRKNDRHINTINESEEQAAEANNSQMEEPVEILAVAGHQESRPRFIVKSASEESLNLVVGGGKLFRCAINCNNAFVRAVVDTGAFISVIDYDVVKRLEWTCSGQGTRLIGADGNLLRTAGVTKVLLEMKLGETTKRVYHNVTVVRNLTAPMLLGLELLRKLNVVINLAENKMYFAKEEPRGGIRTRKDENIPARSQKVVNAQVKAIGTVLTKPFYFSNGIMMANSISKVEQESVPVVLMNSTTKPITLKSGTQLASFEKFDGNNGDEKIETNSINQVLKMEGMQEKIRVGDNLNDSQVSELLILLETFKEAFSLRGEIGKTSVHEHLIELLPDSRPFAEPLRRRAQIQVDETRRQVAKLLEEDIIEESSSPWASAYVLAKKKNGEFRLCIDFRKLNSMTKKTVYPLPNIDECLETLSGKRYFTQLDFRSGFWQIAMDEKSRELTSFRTEDGLFQFKRMPFGLTNAPASFQKTINTVLAGLKGLNLQVFIDDVCIATKSWPEHLSMLRSTLKAVIKANLKINADKCVFGAQTIKFLGHEISELGIRQDPNKLNALVKLPEPRDAKEVKRVLGMFSYYRKFVDKFALIVEPLTRLTRKGVEFAWEEEQKTAFHTVLSELAKNATLTHFNHRDPVLVKTDASRAGVAGMLLQKQDDDWRLVTCCSRRLSTSEANYGITDLEGLALIYTITKLRPYLLGKKFQILVDHCPLCVLNQRTPNSARLRRWAILLSEFEFEITYTKGSQHCDIDCLSRAPVDDPIDCYLEDRVYLIAPADHLG